MRGNAVLQDYGTTIFTVMSALASELGAINLGQGFPDGNGPDDVRAEAARALIEGPNQYPPMRGLPALRRAVADHDRRFFGLDVDPDRGVLVTSGATEAIACAILGLVDLGDEVIVFEPLYDSYVPMIRRAGAVPRIVRLTPPDWAVPLDALRAAITPATRLILLNTPHNPCGKVWTAAELDAVAALCLAHDLLAVSDEVYEHLVFPPARHLSLLSRPGMAGRAVKIGSAGKTFSLTGWKVGYLSGAPDLIDAIARAHQFVTFTTAPNLQAAVAYGLAKDDAYFADLAADLAARRDRLAQGLAACGFDVLKADGTYFLSCGYDRFSSEPAAIFAESLVRGVGVAAIPYDPFYATPDPPRLVRFCFCKPEAMLDAAIARLSTL